MKVTNEMIRRVKDSLTSCFTTMKSLVSVSRKSLFPSVKWIIAPIFGIMERTPAKSSPEYPLSVLAKLNLRKIISAIMLL